MLWSMVKTFFDQPINNQFETYGSSRNIATGKEDDYTTGHGTTRWLQ